MIERLLKITEKVEKALQEESEKTRFYTNIYNKSLICLNHATEILKLAKYGQGINVQSADKVLLRCLIDTWVKIAYMMQYTKHTYDEQEKILKGMERGYLEKGRKMLERRIEFLNKNISKEAMDKLKNDLKDNCKKSSQRIKGYEDENIDSAPEIYDMIYMIFKNELSTQSLFAMYSNCHSHVHCYPGALLESCYNHNDIYAIYIQTLLACNVGLSEEDKKFLLEKLKSLMDSH